MTTAKVFLRHPLEFRAFAKFCEEMADIAPAVDAYNDARYGSGVTGSAGRIGADQSETANEVLDPDGNPPTDAAPATAPKRERGQPSPGKKRRTAAEIAEDDAADLADAQPIIDRAEAVAEAKTLAEHAAEQSNISATPEDRQDPENPEPADDEETAAADAADEAAETAAASTGKLTHDSVRDALGKYVNLYGMAAAQEDGPVLIKRVLGDETKGKISDLPDDQAVLAKAIAGVEEMLKKNPFSRSPVSNG